MTNTIPEAIEVFEGYNVDLPPQEHEDELRYKLIGETASGRVLVVLWTEGKAPESIRIFNAYSAKPRETRVYRNYRR